MRCRAPSLLAAFGGLVWCIGVGWSATQLNQRSDNDPQPSAVANSVQSDPRAAEILLKVAARLDGCRKLDISVAADLRTVWGPGSDLRQTATAQSSFDRDTGRWLIEGKTTPIHHDPKSGAPYRLRSDPNGTTFALSIFNGGKPTPLPDLEQALAALMGVTARTASLVPELVLPMPFEEPKWNPDRDRILHFLAKRAEMEPESTLDGKPCFCVRSEHDFGTWVLWIEKQSLLPAKVTVTRNEAQLNRYRPGSGMGYWDHTYRLETAVAR